MHMCRRWDFGGHLQLQQDGHGRYFDHLLAFHSPVGRSGNGSGTVQPADTMKRARVRTVSSNPPSSKSGAQEEPRGPRRPKSAFLCFLSLYRSLYKSSVGSAFSHQRTLCAAAGEAWRAMPHDQRAPFVRESEASKLEWSRYMGSQGRVRKRKMKVQLPVVEQRDATPSQASASVSSRGTASPGCAGSELADTQCRAPSSRDLHRQASAQVETAAPTPAPRPAALDLILPSYPVPWSIREYELTRLRGTPLRPFPPSRSLGRPPSGHYAGSGADCGLWSPVHRSDSSHLAPAAYPGAPLAPWLPLADRAEGGLGPGLDVAAASLGMWRQEEGWNPDILHLDSTDPLPLGGPEAFSGMWEVL
uniref:HMG box domain-containing protein n=1 Tax=Auxenochlorella protothecoides TaxID=3075 RepID=A0A1D2A5P0_AUXPR